MFAERATEALVLPTSGFTPEMVLALVRERMDDLDFQLEANMTALNDRMAISDQLAKKIQAAQSIQAQLAAQFEDDDGVAELTDDTTLTIDGVEVRGASAIQAALQDIGLGGLITNDDDTLKILSSQVDSTLNKFQTQQRQINSGNDQLMLQIQSLTQKRSQLLQLGTSLIGKLNESANAIAQNIGR